MKFYSYVALVFGLAALTTVQSKAAQPQFYWRVNTDALKVAVSKRD
jgi:hypothetical protein